MERIKYIPNMRFVEKSDINEFGGTCLTASFAKAVNDLHGLRIYDGHDVYEKMNPSGKRRSNYSKLFRAVKKMNRFRLDTRTDVQYRKIERNPTLTVSSEIESGNKVICIVEPKFWVRNITGHELERKGVKERARRLLRPGGHVVLAKGLEKGDNGELRIKVDDYLFRNSMSISEDCFNECISGTEVVVVSKIDSE